MSEDFGNQMLDSSNYKVDELCGCTGKEKTRSNRVLKEHHESWCFYFMHEEERAKKLKELNGVTSNTDND